MDNEKKNELLQALDSAWSEWGESKANNPDWNEFTQVLARIIGCAPGSILVKVVRNNNYTVRLNEALLTKGVVYAVLICDSSNDLSSSQLITGPNTKITNGSFEGVLVFSEVSQQQSGTFELFKIFALEHSPVVEKLKIDGSEVQHELIPNPVSIRAALLGAAKCQSVYRQSTHDPEMIKRAEYLSLAATSLFSRLNQSPTTNVSTVKANTGIGSAVLAPYLRIFDNRYSSNAQTGFYVCVFIVDTGEDLVVSIQHAATSGHTTDFKSLPSSEVDQLSQEFFVQLSLNPSTALIVDKWNMSRVSQIITRAKNYNMSNIASIVLPTSDLPSDTEIVEIIQDLLSLAHGLNTESLKDSSPTDVTNLSVASRIHWQENQLLEVLDSLTDESPQIVLAGPPGTGKTYVSRFIASQLLGVPGQINDERISIVQFHPTYGYEDFVEGLRPIARDGSIVFDTVPGSIVKLAKDIYHDGESRVLIIDEINRANIARVFGELMYLLEYRDEKINLMLHEGFMLPKQLYIIATMNTADKSTRVMDAALRRRFDFFQLNPDVEVLKGHYESGLAENAIGEELYTGFVKLNERLGEDLDQHRLIGHSYFMADYFDFDSLRSRWSRQIAPLLSEYFYERQSQADKYSLEEFWPNGKS
jgi:hypothetical protein